MNLDLNVPAERSTKHFPVGSTTLDDIANESTIIIENVISTLNLACQCIESSNKEISQNQIKGLLNQAIVLLVVVTGHFDTLITYTGYGHDQKQKLENILDTVKCVLCNGLGYVTPRYLSPTVYGLLITLRLIEDSLDTQHSNEFDPSTKVPVAPNKPVNPVSQHVH